MPRHELIMPELGIESPTPTVSLWLVARGSEVIEGDAVLEVLAGVATIDLPAPATGVLIETLAVEGEPLRPGETLAVIESDADDS